VVIDPRGGIHSLARCVGANAKLVRERMADLDIRLLPTIESAKALMLTGHTLFRQPDDQEKAKRPDLAGLEWTDRAGMVEQQRAALDWVKEAAKYNRVRVEQIDRRQATGDDAIKRREGLLRAFAREIDQGLERGGHDPTER